VAKPRRPGIFLVVNRSVNQAPILEFLLKGAPEPGLGRLAKRAWIDLSLMGAQRWFIC
jgi:hypothetical protein